VLDEFRGRLFELAALAEELSRQLARRGPTLPAAAAFAVARVALWADKTYTEGARLLAALEAAGEGESE
jgi:hypothetical protein